MDKRVNIWYDPVGDLLEVCWGTAHGYYAATTHEQVEANVNSEGDIQGFLVFGVSKLDTDTTVDLTPLKSVQVATND